MESVRIHIYVYTHLHTFTWSLITSKLAYEAEDTQCTHSSLVSDGGYGGAARERCGGSCGLRRRKYLSIWQRVLECSSFLQGEEIWSKLWQGFTTSSSWYRRALQRSCHSS